MDLLQGILGGQQEQQQFDDFSRRYQQGAPWDGINDDEAYGHYQRVSGRVPPDVYEASARDAFERLSPQQRAEFGQYLRQRAQQQGVQGSMLQDLDGDGYADPSSLARTTSRLDQQQPGMLGQLLGMGGASSGGMGGMLSNPIGKAVLGGIAAMAVQRMTSR